MRLKFIVTVFSVLLSAVTFAAPAWHITTDKSTLTFSATQNGAPVHGTFEKFGGTIQFDPADLKTSHVEIKVNLAAIKMGDSQLADTLKTADWFDASVYPEATFKADAFTAVSDKEYQANGTLTLRGKTLPVVLQFTLETYAAHEALVKGKTVLKRTAFGVGQGDWAKTDAVKDDVTVEFQLAATR